MTLKNLRPLVVALGTLAIVAACGGGGGGGGTTAKESLTIGGFNFSESSILADMYGQALKAKGYSITYKLNRLMQVKGEVRQEWLRSSIPGVDYAATVFMLGMRLQR